MAASVKRFSYVRSAEYTEDENGVREYRDYYLAETTERIGAIAALRRHRPDLQRWQPHKDDPAALVRRFAAVQRKHSLLWDITIDYSTAAGEEDDDPLNMPAAIELGESTQSQPVFKDTNGDWNINTAGRLLEGIEEEFSFITFSITKNIGPWDSWLLQYRQAVNSDAVYIKGLLCQPRTLKVGSLTIGSEQPYGDGELYAQLRMNLIHNEDTWDRSFLNRGYEEVVVKFETDPNDPKNKIVVSRVEPCVDKTTGIRLSEPQFLDAYGQRPRVLKGTKKIITVPEQLKRLKTVENANPDQWEIKEPLDPEDIIFLKKQTRKPLPFNILPIR